MDIDPPPPPVGGRALWASVIISAVILVLAALSLARSVMTPIAFALFIIALVWPLQRRLQRRLPQLLAVLITAAVALLAIGFGCWLIVWGFGHIVQWIIANSSRLQSLYTRAADLLEARGLYAAELVAQQFNMFYHKHHILSEEDPKRKTLLLSISDLVEKQLVTALDLLGIQAPEKM